MAGDAGADAGRDALTPLDGETPTDETPTDETPTKQASTDENGADPVASTDTEAPVVGVASDASPAPREGHFTRGWVAAGVAALVVLAAAVTTAGVLAWRADDATAATARADAAAMDAARSCVSATHAPDLTAMTAAQTAIIECSTGDFAVQANFYSGVLVDAYQAADVRMRMTEMHSAVERHHDDGSVDVLVAFRVAMSNAQSADKEIGYRLRAVMALDDGRYKLARLDTVSS